jgi:hypothetical protein
MLSEDERKQAVAELYKAAAGEYCTDIRNRLTMQLRHAEASGDHETAERVLGQIAALNSTWQAFE